ncbi:C4-dicarboxylate TRAP transporter small permease protein DctQ [Rhodoferax lithotrophicus]|uniref:TRAP transporter small permease protein n=1 Tax=Rhodoferax lithotrophicus TaxID=2798804 RepID=A0ABN6D4K5_9BURK|nr:TRAP transporter small permease [Rhodoferax sp. MIZ03]BCO26473.1 C4-dicarboxylate TRAP transporter small permease protein DctQ [Rhodoferax sp. MIZ03]
MKLLDRLEELLIAFLISGATLVIFAAVVHRFLASWNIPLIQDLALQINMSWAQELCIIMFVWMAKFGAAYGVRTGIHVGVDVVINRLSDNKRRHFVLFGLLSGAVFTVIVAALGVSFVWENGAHYAVMHVLGQASPDLFPGPTTPDLEWQTWVVYSAIPLGTALMCFRFLQVAYTFARTGELPHHDHSHVDGLDEIDITDEFHPHEVHSAQAATAKGSK